MTDDERKERKRLQGLKANATWRAKNRERERERNRQYRSDNPGKVKTGSEAYRRKHPERARAATAAWRAAHREETRAKAKATRQASPEQARAYDRAYRLEHPEIHQRSKEKYRATQKAKETEALHRQQYYSRNKSAMAAKHLAWARANPGVVNAIAMKRWAAKLRAKPAWADFDAIEAVYVEAARLTRETGIRHEVDHIYPLQSDVVCGLHCEANLQILTKADNIRKHNRMPVHDNNPAISAR